MLERGKLDRGIVEMVDTESLVPKDHLLRKIDAAVDFNRLYEMVEPLYSEDNGRPSVDPVVLFKMVLIQHLYGLPSLRKTADEVGLNVAYRWFLGYTLQEETPHFSKEKTHTVTKSITDQDCGLFVKGNHKRQFAYEAHAACDKHGFVLETVVTPGNVHDSVAFDEVYDKVTKAFPEAETIVADSAYKTPHICKKVFDDGRVLLIIL